jgi:hypothetical protein
MVCYNVESLPRIDKDFYSRLASSQHELIQVSNGGIWGLLHAESVWLTFHPVKCIPRPMN